MASSSNKREEERNEKIIRGLMKLPPNRRCINCDALGPQYVCTNFWTFVCTTCSGIHREFTHRVKSVSMAKFTKEEVEALQRGGNQRAREIFLNEWDAQRMRLPNNSNPEKIREFIKNVYVDKKFSGSTTSDKPPKGTQSSKGEEDHRRASSYHSFSQSPPYDHQYEERRYGRQAGMLTRKPGSDRGNYEGKISSFLYSPGRQAEKMYEDRFANDGSGSRMSDFSVSSDPCRYDGQSPNFHDPGYNASSQIRNIIVGDTQPKKIGTSSVSNVGEDIYRIPRAHRSASSGSFSSFDSNPISVKSTNSGSLMDSILEPDHATGAQQTDTSIFPSGQQIHSGTNMTNIDPFNQEIVQAQKTFSMPSIDMFASFNHQPSSMPPNEPNIPAVPVPRNEGWATFDVPQHGEPPFKANQGLPPIVPPGQKDASKGGIDLFSPMHNNEDWFSAPTSHAHSSLMPDQWLIGLNEVKESADSRNLQLLDAFQDTIGNIPPALSKTVSQNNRSESLICGPVRSLDPYVGVKAPEVKQSVGFFGPTIDDKGDSAVAAVTGVAVSSFHPSPTQMEVTAQAHKAINPFDLPYDSESEAYNMLFDMNPLHAALPDLQLPATFPGGLPEAWFPQSSLTSFVPPAPQGGLAYIGGQLPSPQLQSMPSQGSVAPLGGNPFA